MGDSTRPVSNVVSIQVHLRVSLFVNVNIYLIFNSIILLIHQTCWHTIMLNNETCNEYKQNTGSSVYIMNIYVLHVYVTSNCMYASSVGIIPPNGN